MKDKIEGPKRTVKWSCFSCKFCRSENYICQGDSAFDVYCTHPSLAQEQLHIGDTRWDTPNWCPCIIEDTGTITHLKNLLKMLCITQEDETHGCNVEVTPGLALRIREALGKEAMK